MIDLSKTVLDSGGNKPALVFLHGFCESKQVWERFTQPLQVNYRVVLLDLPGFGANTERRSDYTMESGATYVKDVLDNLGIQKCALIGHSMGGYMGLVFAEKYAGMLRGLCLFHSSALPDSAEKKQNRNRTIEFIQKHGLDKFMDTFVAPLFYEGNRAKNQPDIQFLAQIGKQGDLEGIIGTVAGMRDRPDRTAVLENISCPVLFIVGKQDPAIPLEQSLQQCALPKRAHAFFLNQTGHVGMFEWPEETLKALAGFAGTLF
ncbi:MAG: alpha/beta hydrolase [Cytophagales bacterium CG18_big_fil_WC_8_21_14_2_50_42_9]|nr:MAG: alpha/beta hydrolase [Cytophagales bacterium CG18_big_fil_WC_8_21_14_2_50_42_9]